MSFLLLGNCCGSSHWRMPKKYIRIRPHSTTPANHTELITFCCTHPQADHISVFFIILDLEHAALKRKELAIRKEGYLVSECHIAADVKTPVHLIKYCVSSIKISAACHMCNSKILLLDGTECAPSQPMSTTKKVTSPIICSSVTSASAAERPPSCSCDPCPCHFKPPAALLRRRSRCARCGAASATCICTAPSQIRNALELPGDRVSAARSSSMTMISATSPDLAGVGHASECTRHHLPAG